MIPHFLEYLLFQRAIQPLEGVARTTSQVAVKEKLILWIKAGKNKIDKIVLMYSLKKLLINQNQKKNCL